MDRIIQWSITNRLFVVIASIGLLVYGVFTVRAMPVDVFPDLTAPTVTVVTEAHGLAPQEVEALVTFPIESPVNGSTGVNRFFGTFERSGESLRFRPLAMTRRAGPPEAMELETALVGAFEAVRGWRATPTELALLDASGGVLVRCERATP